MANSPSPMHPASSANGQEEMAAAGDGRQHSQAAAEQTVQEPEEEGRGVELQEVQQQQQGQLQKEAQESASAWPTTRLGRFNIQPFRGALDGLNSLFTRGGGRNGKATAGEALKVEEKRGIDQANEPVQRVGIAAAADSDNQNEQIEKYNGQEEKEKLGERSGEGDGELLEPVVLEVGLGQGRKPVEESQTEQGRQRRPEPKPRRRIRRGSIVHPMEGGGGAADEPTMRPRSLSSRKLQKPLGPSRQSPWIYVQMPDRSFKQTTEAELASRRQTLGNLADDGTFVVDPASLPEFAPLNAAIGIQTALHGLALVLQGFLSGLAFGHAVFALVWMNPGAAENEQNWLVQLYSSMAIPIQTFFFVCLTIAAVDALDRFELPKSSSSPSIFELLRQCFFSAQFFAIFCWMGAFLASISCAQVDEYFARNDVETIKKQDWLLLTVWRCSSGIRAILCLSGWLLIAQNPSKNSIAEELRGIIQNISADNRQQQQKKLETI